jgi:hypothetical protein
VTHVDGNAFLLATSSIFFQWTCDLMVGTDVLLSMEIFRANFHFKGVTALHQSAEKSFRVGEYFEVGSPSKHERLIDPSIGLQIYFTVDPPLPKGLSISPSTGLISGTFATASASADYSIHLYDPIVQLSHHVWTLESLEVLPPPESDSSIVSPAAYAVPVAVVLLALLIVYLYVRNDMKKEYHIFISYRGLCVVISAYLSSVQWPQTRNSPSGFVSSCSSGFWAPDIA